MPTRTSLPCLILLCLSPVPSSLGAEDQPRRPPNVLLIVTDDQGYGDLARHGNPHLATPHLDRLGAASVRLEDYHVDPVCTPTRAALLTGRYCTRVGAWDVTHGRQLLHPREVTMANVFRDSGYRTAMFGKWHLGDSWPYDPASRGFDEVVCCRAGGVDEIGNPAGNDYFDDVYYRNGTPEKFTGYCTDVFVREATRFIASASSSASSSAPSSGESYNASDAGGKPFFVYLATNAMHSPFRVADRYARKFRELGLPEKLARFYGMIENFDENLGELLATLDRLDIADNTIVIFMGDNGTAANSGAEGAYNAGMRGVKGSVYEGGHRVACFVRWPAGLRGAHAIDQLTTQRDWLPTLIELCGLREPNVDFDGRSLAPLLRGEASSWPERTLFVQRQATDPVMATSAGASSAIGPNGFPQYAVLTERWRLVNGELYDIGADPSQTRDLAAHHPEVVEELKSSYTRHFQDVFRNVEDDARFIVGDPHARVTEFTVRDWRPTVGSVIWEHPQLQRDDLSIHGYWPIEVVTAGAYQIEFARFPFAAERPMGARLARLEVAGQAPTQELDSSATRATFRVSLPAGKARLTGELTDAATQLTRGPYFVRVRHEGD